MTNQEAFRGEVQVLKGLADAYIKLMDILAYSKGDWWYDELPTVEATEEQKKIIMEQGFVTIFNNDPDKVVYSCGVISFKIKIKKELSK